MKQPILLYDNHCKLCSRFASIVRRLSRYWIRVIGHYSIEGERFANLPDARDMFWIIIDEYAYGGRDALLPLVKEVIRGMLSNSYKQIDCIEYECRSCSILSRIRSLLINGRKIKI